MLKRKKPLCLPRLTDVTLMAAPAAHAAADDVRRLYLALLEIGVMVQLPAHLAQTLCGCLAPERTLIAAGGSEADPGGFAGILSDSCRPWQTSVMKECALDAQTPPAADLCRLSVDAGLFLTDYEARFARFLRRAAKPAMLCARGEAQLATALSVSYLLQGGAAAAACLPGAGSRASLEAMVMALTLHGEPGLNPHALPVAAAAWETVSGQSIPAHQPVLGPRIFDVSSGVHVNGLLKDAGSYEPFSPETVGRARRIVLDQHSGQSAVAARLLALGIAADTLSLPLLTRRVRDRGRACGEVSAEAFAALVRQAQQSVCA